MDDLRPGGQLISGSVDPITGRISVLVVFDDGTLQATLDKRFGQGLVTVGSWLQPIA
jgi:hypothetical protein